LTKIVLTITEFPFLVVSHYFKNGFILYSRFGFIETLSHDKEIFFHFSNFDGKAEKLEVGTEVEYCVFNREKGGKISAEGVKVNIIRSPSPVC
jgi:cold shock CspA family protein